MRSVVVADLEGQIVHGRHVAVALGQPGGHDGRRVAAARHGYNLTRNLLTASAVVRLWLLASPCWSRPSPRRCSRPAPRWPTPRSGLWRRRRRSVPGPAPRCSACSIPRPAPTGWPPRPGPIRRGRCRASPRRPSPSTPTSAPVPRGAATIVFARCQTPTRCRLSRTTPAGGTETPITGSAATDGWESAPTVWGNRIAFARHYATGSERVYIRPLDAGRRVRSVRLPGVPARECERDHPLSRDRRRHRARDSSCAARRWPRTCISALSLGRHLR